MRLLPIALCCLFAPACFPADPALTIYNQQFAVVRETIPLDLKQGANQLEFTGTTAQLEPESVMLRDPSGRRALRILEQNYRADPVSLEALLKRYEGQTIQFEIHNGDRIETVSGKIVRAGGTTIPPGQNRWFLNAYQQPQPMVSQAIIEVAGKSAIRSARCAHVPRPRLRHDSEAHTQLDHRDRSGRSRGCRAGLHLRRIRLECRLQHRAERFQNVIDLTGWVTLVNASGKEFENAHVKLMAGDVNKIQPAGAAAGLVMYESMGAARATSGPQVVEKTFDEYHLYTLQRPVTIHDRESKQVEFVRTSGVKSDILYVYDGAKIDRNRYQGWQPEMIRQDPTYGTLSNPKVWVMREFMNSEANHLGMPLPKGRVRFYRRDTDGRLEFTGEDSIDHTPKDEKIRVFTGAAFDLTGERIRTNFHNERRQMMDEAFEIKVRNHKKEPVEVRVVEHLYRWYTWEISTSSMPYTKTDAQTIEFRAQLQPDEEKKITYEAHYTW